MSTRAKSVKFWRFQPLSLAIHDVQSFEDLDLQRHVLDSTEDSRSSRSSGCGIEVLTSTSWGWGRLRAHSSRWRLEKCSALSRCLIHLTERMLKCMNILMPSSCCYWESRIWSFEPKPQQGSRFQHALTLEEHTHTQQPWADARLHMRMTSSIAIRVSVYVRIYIYITLHVSQAECNIHICSIYTRNYVSIWVLYCIITTVLRWGRTQNVSCVFQGVLEGALKM